jgi:hypothetical protein
MARASNQALINAALMRGDRSFKGGLIDWNGTGGLTSAGVAQLDRLIGTPGQQQVMRGIHSQFALRPRYGGGLQFNGTGMGGPSTVVGNGTGLGGGDGGFRYARAGLLGSAPKSPYAPPAPPVPNPPTSTGLRQQYMNTIAGAQFGGLKPGMVPGLGGERQGFLRPAIPTPTPQASAAGVKTALTDSAGLGLYAREVPGVARQNGRAVAISPDNRIMEMTPQQIRVAGLAGRAPWVKGPTEQELAANRQAYQARRQATLAERRSNVTKLRQQEAQQRQMAQQGSPNAFMNALMMRNPELAIRMMEANQRGLLAQQELGLRQQGLMNEYNLGSQRNQNDADRNRLLDQQVASERGLKFAEAAQQEEANAIAYMQAGQPKEAAAARQRAAQYRAQGQSLAVGSQVGPQAPQTPALNPVSRQSLSPDELSYVRGLPAGERRAWLMANTKLKPNEIQGVLDNIEGPSSNRDASRAVGSMLGGLGDALGGILSYIGGEMIPDDIEAGLTNPYSPLIPEGSQLVMPAQGGRPITVDPKTGRPISEGLVGIQPYLTRPKLKPKSQLPPGIDPSYRPGMQARGPAY